MSIYESGGVIAQTYPVSWVSVKKETKGFVLFYVPFVMIFILVLYFFISFATLLVVIVGNIVIVSLLLGHLALGKEKSYTIINASGRTEDRKKDEQLFWKLIHTVEKALEEGGFRYEKVYKWPKTTYRIADRGFNVVVWASVDGFGTIFRFQLGIGPLTSDNHLYLGDCRNRLSDALVREGLVSMKSS